MEISEKLHTSRETGSWPVLGPIFLAQRVSGEGPVLRRCKNAAIERSCHNVIVGSCSPPPAVGFFGSAARIAAAATGSQIHGMARTARVGPGLPQGGIAHAAEDYTDRQASDPRLPGHHRRACGALRRRPGAPVGPRG